MSDYKFDVFISYPHEERHKKWVHDIFVDDFKTYLTEELGWKPEIFLDERVIDPGHTWPMKLKEGLAHSKILVPVWSVNYFLSDWCRQECAAFLYREEILGYRKSNSDGLIYPIQLFDGERYPEFTSSIQWFKCKQHNRYHLSYRQTKPYSKLKKAIEEKFAPAVAQAIANAPAWSQEWLTQKWYDDVAGKWAAHPDFRVKIITPSAPSMA